MKTLSYDNNGNLTAHDSTDYVWDYRNRLTSVGDGSATTTYAYDHTEQRVEKDVAGVTTVYPNQYWNKAGATTTRHIMTPSGELLATVEGNGTATSTYYIHTDHLGGTNVVSNESGEAVEVIDYYPFGAQRVHTGSYTEQRKFTGHEYDTSSDLTYANARYYEQNVGRWTAQDPIAAVAPEIVLDDPQQLNTYAYVRNNPLNLYDPTGLLTVATHGTKAEGDNEGYSDQFQLEQMAIDLGDTGNEYRFRWSGDNTIGARQDGANKLTEFIDNYDFAPGEQLNLIGHSHGGNVNILTANQIDREVNNMILLGTPNRPDYELSGSNVQNVYNIYSPDDGVQTIGGRFWDAGQTKGQSREGATNLKVNYSFDPGFVKAHSLLKSQQVWSAVTPFITN